MGSWPRWRIVALLVAIGGAEEARAQVDTGILSGQVIDGAAGRPLPGAIVTATGPAAPAGRTAVTDGAGRFVLAGLPPGIYRLEAQAAGYLPDARGELVVKASTTLRASLALVPEAVELEEVVVTGSRVPRKDLLTPAPVTVISREQIAQDSRLTLGDLLQTLPEQGNALNRQFNNGGDGSTRVSLRSLGDYRTLVLVNGRRFVAGGVGADRAVDLSVIPASAIERIEILKDGASPIYGSDAVGGVINVITRRRWTGLEVGLVGGASERGDGVSAGVDAAMGRFGDEAGFLLSATYLQLGSAMAGDRTWSAKPYTWDYLTGTKGTAGSPATPESGVHIGPSEMGVPNGNKLWNDLVAAYPNSRRFIHDPTAPLGWRPFMGVALPENGGDGYNFAPENYLVTPAWQTTVLATGEAQVPGLGRFTFEASYGHRESEQLLAPMPLATLSYVEVVSADNVYNPFQRDFEQVVRRLVEIENRRFRQDIDLFRLVAGVDGVTPGSWGPFGELGWDLSANLGRSQATQLIRGFVSGRMLALSLGPSFIDPGANGTLETASGQAPQGDDVARCGTAASPIAGCVPLNLFGGPGSITPEMVNQLTYVGQTRGTNQLVSLQANATGQTGLLGRGRPTGFAVGYEYRSVFGEFIPDTLSMSGDRLGVSQQPTRGSADVHELYAEATVPLLADLPAADLVEVMAAARAFKHQGFSSDWTWKVGARWRPVRDFTLRGTASTAYRVPAISELYLGQTLGDFDIADDVCADLDPASNPAATPARIAHCTAAGVPAGGTQQQFSVPAPQLGNPALRPEVARIYTAGVVLEPRFLRGFSATADLWTARVSRSISLPGGWLVLESCYPRTAEATPALCHLVDRDPATGQLFGVTNQMQNAGSEEVAGIDFAIRQEFATRAGRFGLSLDGTWLARHDLVLPDGTLVRAKGNYDAFLASATAMSGLNPELVANLGANWAWSGLRLAGTLHYVSSSRECGNLNPGTGTTVPDLCTFSPPYSRRIDAFAGVDASVEYAVRSGAGQTKVWLGVQNVLDQAPPFVATNGFYTSDPSAFTLLGRTYQVRVSHAF